MVLWALAYAGYEISDSERALARPYADIIEVRGMFDRCAALFVDLEWMEQVVEAPASLTVGRRTVPTDMASWAEVAAAMAADALALMMGSDQVQAHRMTAVGDPRARRLAALIRLAGGGGPDWRNARRRRGVLRRAAP